MLAVGCQNHPQKEHVYDPFKYLPLPLPKVSLEWLNIKFCVLVVVGHVMHKPWDNKMSLKWAWSGSLDLLNYPEVSDSVLEMVKET